MSELPIRGYTLDGEKLYEHEWLKKVREDLNENHEEYEFPFGRETLIFQAGDILAELDPIAFTELESELWDQALSNGEYLIDPEAPENQ